jgi:hypothetical protein
MDKTAALENFDNFLDIMDDQLDAPEEDAAKFGIALDYSMESLGNLEKLFNEMSKGMDKEKITSLVVYFARYLGEVFVRNYNGKWALSLDDPKNVYFNTPVIVGHSSIKELDFSPIFVMRAYSLRRKLGLFKTAIEAHINPTPLDLSHLAEE